MVSIKANYCVTPPTVDLFHSSIFPYRFIFSVLSLGRGSQTLWGMEQIFPQNGHTIALLSYYKLPLNHSAPSSHNYFFLYKIRKCNESTQHYELGTTNSLRKRFCGTRPWSYTIFSDYINVCCHWASTYTPLGSNFEQHKKFIFHLLSV